MDIIADGLEHADITEADGELRLVAPREFGLALRSKELRQLVQNIAGKPLKVTFTAGEAVGRKEPETDRAQAVEEATKRALADPEVQRFREVFPASEVRVVRNLKQ